MKKKTLKELGYVPLSVIKADLMKRPGFKKAYEDLELEYRLISALIDMRTKKKMTQRALAEKIGTKQSAIARFESGRANPRLSFLKKLSRALDVKLTVTR